MILTSKLVNKIFNSDYIKNIYPMIDNVDVDVEWDGDEEFPFYKLFITVKLNDPTITKENMYDKAFDPHYLYDNHLKYLLKFLNINRDTATIEQAYLTMVGPNGKHIYTW
jgi:hypothetical protein